MTGESGTTVYAITTPAAAARLDDLGFWVDRLGAEGEPLTTDLYLLRDDRQLGSGFLTLDGNATELFDAGPAARAVLASSDEGLLVAVPAGSSVERFHFSGAQHGHNLKLVPTATLLEQIDAPLSLGGAAAERGGHHPGGEGDPGLEDPPRAARRPCRPVRRRPTRRY